MSRLTGICAAMCLVFSSMLARAAAAADWYVASQGDPANKGTQQDPWDLKSTMRDGHGVVRAGDVVWLTPGTYTTMAAPVTNSQLFPCLISGEPDKPITIRALPGARVTIDGDIAPMGHDVTFWGLELITSSPRSADPQDWAKRPNGGFYTEQGTRCKLINCVIHDNNEGVTLWTEAGDNEVYGCLIYHNGTIGPTRGHGHGIYAKGTEGRRRLADNVTWNNYGYGIHCYAEEGGEVNNVQIVGNILFANGMPASPQGCTNLLVGTTGKACRNILVADNVSYMHPMSNRLNTKMFFATTALDAKGGYAREPNEDLVCTNNVLINGRYALSTGCWKRMTLTGNKLFARSLVAMMPIETVKPGERGDYVCDHNEYVMGGWIRPFELGWGLSEKMIDAAAWREQSGFDAHSTFREDGLGYPKGVDVFVRPNQYEPGRAHIAVLNWDRKPEVKVDLKGVLKEGQPYRIFNVQKLWDAPVASGVYDGKEVAVPALLSWLAPEFDAYLVLPSTEGEGR